MNLCEQLGIRFLNTAEVLKGENGYGIAEYYTNGDIHLKTAGLKAALNYLRTPCLFHRGSPPGYGQHPDPDAGVYLKP